MRMPSCTHLPQKLPRTSLDGPIEQPFRRTWGPTPSRSRTGHVTSDIPMQQISSLGSHENERSSHHAIATMTLDILSLLRNNTASCTPNKNLSNPLCITASAKLMLNVVGCPDTSKHDGFCLSFSHKQGLSQTEYERGDMPSLPVIPGPLQNSPDLSLHLDANKEGFVHVKCPRDHV